jgi:hypothetical protein
VTWASVGDDVANPTRLVTFLRRDRLPADRDNAKWINQGGWGAHLPENKPSVPDPVSGALGNTHPVFRTEARKIGRPWRYARTTCIRTTRK